MSQDEPAPSTPRVRSSVAIIIALAPAVVYGIAFIYEVGFASHFEIPIAFITIGLEKFFTAAGTLLGLLIAFLMLFIIVHHNLPANDKTQLFLFDRLIVVPAMMFFAFFLLGPDLGYFIFILIIFLPIMLIYYLLPIFRHKQIKGYMNKLKSSEELESRHAQTSRHLLWPKFGTKSILHFIILSLMFPIAYGAGWSNAANQEYFLVLERHKKEVVLRIYGETMICKPMDSEMGIFWALEPVFIIRKVGESSEFRLRRERIGPAIMQIQA